MNYYFLDKVSWEHSQALYHAAAYLQHEALFILRPNSPYVCIGFHQDAEQEIDLAYTEKNHIPVFRREVGGGAVFLDGNQLFYQLIMNKHRSGVPDEKDELYKKYLAPVVETYRQFGVKAEYKPVNDIVANGRKVSGNGAAEINEMYAIVGNFILDFDYETMSRCLRVPDEKFRDKVHKTLQENLSTFLRETGSAPEAKALGDSLASKYEAILGSMNWKTAVDETLLAKADELIAEMHTPEWLFANDRRRPGGRTIKIRDGVEVIQNTVKAPGGLIRISAVRENGKLHDVHISGDFFFYPAEKLAGLEKELEGVEFDPARIEQMVSGFYTKNGIESPGVLPADISRAILPVPG